MEAATFPFLNGLGHYLPNPKLAEVTGKLNQLLRADEVEGCFFAASKEINNQILEGLDARLPGV